MSASLGAAIKAYLETKGLGIQFFKDAAPDGTALLASDGKTSTPYGTIIEGIGLRMDPMEDGGPANGGVATAKELVQLDLWQKWQDTTGKVCESPTLPDAITRAIHGSRLLTSGPNTPPGLVYSISQEGRIRILDRNSGIVQHAYTLGVHRVV